jgi:hypothetical protein
LQSIIRWRRGASKRKLETTSLAGRFGCADAVVGDERLLVGIVGRDAGGYDGFASIDACDDFEVEVEELLEEVLASEKP